jgi:ribonuclease HI
MSKAHRSTTNNEAEYHGLLAGLRAAAAHWWPNLEVVGDSALTLGQMRDYRPPKNARLLRLYAQARRLTDQLAVRTTSWLTYWPTSPWIQAPVRR